MRRWWAGLVACAVAVSLLLAGCAEKHQASESLPTTSKTATSKTLPPLGPADFPVPAEARQKSRAGVTAFARYYVDLLNHQLKTLDSAPLRDLSQNCGTCNALADTYDHAKTSGRTVEGGRITVISTGTAVVNGDQGEVSFLLNQAPVTVRDAQGSPLADQSKAGVTLGGGVRVSWSATRNSWIVTQLDANKV